MYPSDSTSMSILVTLLCILPIDRVALEFPDFPTFLIYSIFRVGWPITRLRMLNRPNLHLTQFRPAHKMTAIPALF